MDGKLHGSRMNPGSPFYLPAPNAGSGEISNGSVLPPGLFSLVPAWTKTCAAAPQTYPQNAERARVTNKR